MRLIGNVLCLILAGFWLAIGYALAGILMFILIITIPFGVASFRLAGYALWRPARASCRAAVASAAASSTRASSAVRRRSVSAGSGTGRA